ncbi:MAG: serine/threonine protein kinase, partial [Actinomycetes bacterium]
DWRPLIDELYARRARAFAAAAPDLLDAVYSPGSAQLAADAEHARALAAAGQELRGFAPAVVAVTGASVRGDRAVLDLVDHWPDYEVVPSGAAGGAASTRAPGRPETAVRMVLLRTPEGWRIERAERSG